MTRIGPGWCPFVNQVEGVTKFSRGGQPKVGIADHTAGGFYSTLIRPSFWNNAGYSVHFAVARDGTAAQIVNIFDRAWGQGRDSNGNSVGPGSPGVTWPPFATMGRKNPNEYLISKEHEDWEIVGGIAHPVPGPTWPTEQLEMSVRIDEWCREEVRKEQGIELFRFGFDSYAGHYMFDPRNRPNCPGAPWKDLYRQAKYNYIFMPDVNPPLESEDDVAAIVAEPDSIRDYLIRGRRLEFIPSPQVMNDISSIYGLDLPAPDVSKETFKWLVDQHIDSGGSWPGGGYNL